MGNSRFVSADTTTFGVPFPVVIDAVKASGFHSLDIWATNIKSLPGGARLQQNCLTMPGEGLLGIRCCATMSVEVFNDQDKKAGTI